MRALSAEFLADVQRHGAIHGDKILDTVAEKYPANYFASMVALSRIMRWETGLPGKIDKPRTPEEIIAKLEERVGPKARKLFERFLRQLNKLQEEQQLQQHTVSPSGATARLRNP